MSDVSHARVGTVLGHDAFRLEGFYGAEELSRVFQFHVELLSHDPSIPVERLLYQPMSVSFEIGNGRVRDFHGIARSVTQEGRSGAAYRYRVEMVPWLRLLSIGADCRAFQDMSVPDIVSAVFASHGYTDFRVELTDIYERRVFCVQYRETHLNFVSRLLEDEGIFFYFDHSATRHTLVLTDSSMRLPACALQPEASYAENADNALWHSPDIVFSLTQRHEVRSGKVTLGSDRAGTSQRRVESTVADTGLHELYDYDTTVSNTRDAERKAQVRLQEAAASATEVRGTSSCGGFQPGCRVSIKNHYRDDLNGPYVLRSVEHQWHWEGDASSPTGRPYYKNNFLAFPASQPYRPARLTPRPFVQGSQTAIVVGPTGETVFADELGRVKVQFHWDRHGHFDQRSSGWIQVARPWTLTGHPDASLPRIGQEVVVDFIEGDPDRPLLTGFIGTARSDAGLSDTTRKTQSTWDGPVMRTQRKLKVFLCHSSVDKPIVRNVYARLVEEGIDAWLDSEQLLAGQEWELEIEKAVRATDAVVVFVSGSFDRAGYVHTEIKKVLEVADKQPSGSVFLIPARLEECELPSRFQPLQRVDLFERAGFSKLMKSLHARARSLGLDLD